ncbi:MAG: ABC transporter ATP-binding protein [Lachnospiraceae bacterium]|nr:ABC transporter ATP-binding protein [Lachnospiraceae bacterium]
MSKIFKNLIPYWRMILMILALLMIQAYCDLSLPQYTSDIIDTGIINGGVSYVLPDQITAEEYEYTELFMTEEERQDWEQIYEREGGNYSCTKAQSREAKEAFGEEFLVPLVLNYRMANMSEEEFRAMVSNMLAEHPQAVVSAETLAQMSAAEIADFLQMDVHVFETAEEDGSSTVYVDVRPLIKEMGAKEIAALRDGIADMADSTGSSTLKSMGIAYARIYSEEAGADMDKQQIRYLWSAGGNMLWMAFLMLAASVGIGYLSAKIGAGVGQDLRNSMFQKVVGFSGSELDQFSTASLITRSTNDIQQIQMVSVIMLRMILYAPIIGIGGICKVAQTGAGMGWIIVLAVVLILGFVLLLVSIAMPRFKMMQKLLDRVNLVSREILTGLSVIRAFGREKKEEERFDEANRNLMKTQLFTNRVMNFMMPGMMFVMYGITLLIVWVSARKIDAGTLQVGVMTAFITYAMQIVMSFLMLTMMSIMLPRAGVAAERIDEVLRTELSMKEPDSPENLREPQGIVRFSGVHFRYPGANEDVLEEIDFTAEPGKTTAIIGSTGCGKSTLVNLIPRFYDVTAGSITIDGKDIRNLSVKELRDIIGYVPQKGVLFSGTIASNLRFGNQNASDEMIQEAAELAQAADFIAEKEQGYESPIAQGGSNVSGGQKQRLAIARAIVKKPKIFVFDDSFSALDMKTDRKLRKALEKHVKDKTVIIVAQRISTILKADEILVLDEGRIVGKGTHTALLKECSIYQQIAKSQLSEKELGIQEKGGEEQNG